MTSTKTRVYELEDGQKTFQRRAQLALSLCLGVTGLDFDARMNAALSSAEFHEARLREEIYHDEGP